MASQIRIRNSWLGIRGSGKYLRIPNTAFHPFWAAVPVKNSLAIWNDNLKGREEESSACVQDKCKPEIFALLFFLHCAVLYLG